MPSLGGLLPMPVATHSTCNPLDLHALHMLTPLIHSHLTLQTLQHIQAPFLTTVALVTSAEVASEDVLW